MRLQKQGDGVVKRSRYLTLLATIELILVTVAAPAIAG